jgi:hypothetical protein
LRASTWLFDLFSAFALIGFATAHCVVIFAVFIIGFGFSAVNIRKMILKSDLQLRATRHCVWSTRGAFYGSSSPAPQPRTANNYS